MKKLFNVIFTILILMPFSIRAKEKVNVYFFTVAGCQSCEKEEEYLMNLDSYNKKFVIIKKELYTDTDQWKPGKDFVLGVKVATAFSNNNFSDATYKGAPLIVISDLYAATKYNDSLETIIKTAYEEGDKDIVKCIDTQNNNCLENYDVESIESEAQRIYDETTSEYTNRINASGSEAQKEINPATIITLILISIFVFLLIICIYNKINKKEDIK